MGIESSFLESWEDWDECGDVLDIQFYNVVVRPEIAVLLLPRVAESMALLLGSEVVEFYDNEGQPILKFNVRLVIAE